MFAKQERPLCNICNGRHPESLPHSAGTPEYQAWFQKEHGRLPTWSDAIAHCSPQAKEFALQWLTRVGIAPFSTGIDGSNETERFLNKEHN